MKNLKLKYPHHYEWLYPVPGDWHVMKTATELNMYLQMVGLKCLLTSVATKGI